MKVRELFSIFLLVVFVYSVITIDVDSELIELQDKLSYCQENDCDKEDII